MPRDRAGDGGLRDPLEPPRVPVVRTLLPAAASSSPPAQEAPSSCSSGPVSLQAIRAEFHEIAGGGGKGRVISAEDIARHWDGLLLREHDDDSRRIGHQRSGKQAKQAIALRAAQLMQDMDLKRAGQVGLEEWVHYMLLIRSGFATKQVNNLLSKALERNGTALQDLQRMFEAADSASSGALSVSEVASMYSRKLWRLKPSTAGASRLLTEEELRVEDPEDLAREALHAMDIDGDQKVSYTEFMAYSLGRRKQEVLLHMYDLSNGAAQDMSPWVLGTKIEGVWHTGVVVYGKEYYYSKDTVYADAGDTSFGKPTRILHLGHTLWRQDELHEFVTAELKPVFQRDTYDVVCNNCNHFSDRVCMFLVGKHPPPEVLNQPSLLLRARAVRVIRPMLNWWLRDRIVAREKGIALPPGQQRLKLGEQPPLGCIVAIHAAHGSGPPILGQVTGAPESLRDGEGEAPCLTGVATMGAFNAAQPGAVGSGSCVALEHGCGGLWGGTCGVVNAGGALQGTTPDGVWVQYFEILPSGTSSRCAQVQTEYIAHARLSLGGLRDPDGEATFRRALKAITSQEIVAAPCGTGHGALPFREPNAAPGGLRGEFVDGQGPITGIIDKDPWQVVAHV